MRSRPLLLGTLATVLAASGFGVLGPVARLAYDLGVQPLAFVVWRASFGLIAIVLIVAVQARRGLAIQNPLRLPGPDLAGLIVVAASGLALNIATFVAFDLTTVALVLLAFYTYPAMVAVVEVGLGHERLDGHRLIALGLALGGMILVVAGGIDPQAGGPPFNPIGVGLGLFGAVSQMLFVTVSRNRFRSISSEQAMGWILLVVVAASIPIAAGLGQALDVPLREPRALGLAALAGVLGAGVPSVLFLIGIRAIGGTRAGILMLIEPLVGVALAAIVLHEALRPIQVLGGAGILAAALALQRGPAAAGPEPIVVAAAEQA